MGICVNGHPYKIDGGQEVSILNSRMLAKGISTWKDDAWVNTLSVFVFIFKVNYFICSGIFIDNFINFHITRIWLIYQSYF